MSKSRHERIADQIAGMIARAPSAPLLCARTLARMQGTSYLTVRKALHLLAAKGLVRVNHGARTVPAGAQDPFISGSSKHRLYERISRDIREGVYPAGAAIPKLEFYVHAYRTSKTTVSDVLLRLERERLLHHQGRQWVAGPAPVRDGRHGDYRIVHLVVADPSSWAPLFYNAFLSSFITAFTAECGKQGMSVLPCCMHAEGAARSPLPAGIDAVCASARSMGERYAGSILFVNARETQEVGQWINRCAALDKPVVLFDFAGNGDAFRRSRLATRNARFFYRLHLDEPSAAACVLARLARAGHRTIGVPRYNDPRYAWMDRRIEILRRVASREYPGVKLLTVLQNERFLDIDYDLNRPMLYIGELLRPPASRCGRRQRRPGPRVVGMPSLSSLLDKGATAIIALNDRMAREYYLRLRECGVRVPRDVSMISFDNIPESLLVPVSTVDFGFGGLGYGAAHLFIGDLLMKADAEGNVPGRCVIIERGSVAGAADAFRKFPKAYSYIR